MLEDFRINELAREVARAQAANANPERVFTRPTTDSLGNDALRITLVLPPSSVRALTGDEALDLLVALQRRLQEAGEERLTLIEYATEADLSEEAKEREEEEDRYEDEA